ncbi:MAG: hypothetical protein NUV91_06520 [Candidatus Omnitrophica bacterium]|nr:hypothetical protein [Candidatus Omnitrophota bacterium]
MNMHGQKSQAVFFFLGLLISFSFFNSHAVWSQEVPEGAKAGAVEKSLQWEAPTPSKVEKELSPLSSPTVIEEISFPDDKKIFVKEFVLQGNTILSTKYLQGLLNPYKNRELTFGELKKTTQIITEAYKEKGYFLARAFLPVQEILEGVITIQIVEGYLGEIFFEGGEARQHAFLKKFIHPAHRGIIHYRKLLRSLLIVNKHTNMKVKAVFREGKRPQTVDIVLIMSDRKDFSAGASYDNYGSRFVSRHRNSVRAGKNNFLFAGDRVSFNATGGNPWDKLSAAGVDYTSFLNSSGTYATTSYSWLDFNAQRQFRVLDVGGRSHVGSLQIVHPLLESVTSSFEALTGFHYKEVQNFLLGDISSYDRLRIVEFGFRGDHLDSWSGRNIYSLNGFLGIANFWDGSLNNDPRASRVGAGGKFQKGVFQLERIQKVTSDVFFLFRSTSQVASDALPVAEQLSIGGATTVRGFPQSEALGDWGQIASFEARIAPPFLAEKQFLWLKGTKVKNMFQLTGFYDYGRVVLRNPLAGEHRYHELMGAGVGAIFFYEDDFNVKVDYGYPVGSERPSDKADSTVYVQANWNF